MIEKLWQFQPIIDNDTTVVVKTLENKKLYEGKAWDLFCKEQDICNLSVADMWQSNENPEVLIISVKEPKRKKYVDADFVIDKVNELTESYVDTMQELRIEINQGEGTASDLIRLDLYQSFIDELEHLSKVFTLLKDLKGKEIKYGN